MSYNQLVAAALARWNGDGNADATPDANDATGNGRDGTWFGTPGYGTGLWGGNSFAFDGSSEISASLGVSGFTNKCLACWVKSPTGTGNNRNIIGIGQDTNNKLTFRINDNGAFRFVVQASVTNLGSGYNDSQYHHLTIVDDGSAAKAFINGVEENSRSSAGVYSSLEINLGSDNFFGSLAAAGMEVFDAIWHTADAWDTDDIAELMGGPEPVNTVAPTLSIDSSGNWTGSVGTWGLPAPFAAGSNGTITYTWELRRDSDDAVISTGSGASPSGSGLLADTDYYLRVTASNDGGSDLPANSAVDSTLSYNKYHGLGGHSRDASIVREFRLQDDAASTVVVDATGTANGTLFADGSANTNARTTTGPNAWLTKALTIGVASNSERIDCGLANYWDSLTGAGFMGWVKFNSTSGDLAIVSNWESATDGHFLFRVDGEEIEFFASAPTQVGNKIGANYLTTGVWYHFCGRYTGSNIEVLIDGESKGTIAAGASLTDIATQELFLGNTPHATGRSLNGDMAGVTVLTASPTNSEIAEDLAGPEPVNTVAPTLSIDGSGNWTGTVGTWALPAPFSSGSNGTITYAWELRRDSDDAVIASGSGASPSGSGLIIDTDYYLRVTASNNGGSDLPADSSIESYIVGGSNYNIDNLDSKILNYSFSNSIIKNSIVNTLDSIINSFSQNNTIFKTSLINNIDSIIRNISLSEYIYKTTLLNNSDSIINNYSLSNSISKNLDINTFGSLIRMFSGINNIYKNSLIINIDSLILNKSSEETIYKISSIINRDNNIRSFSETNRISKTSPLTSSGSLNNNYSEQNQLYLNIDLVSGIISINNSFSGNELLSITKTLLSHNSYNSIISDSRNISSNFSLSNIDNLIRVLSEASNLSFGSSIDIDNINSKILIFSTSNIISNNFNLNINNSKNNVISDQELITGNFNTVNVNNLIRSYSQTNSIKSNFSIINNDSVNILLSDTNRIERVIDLLQSKSKGVFISREDALLISYLLNNIDSKNQVLNGLEQISSSLSLDNTDSYILIVSPSSNITDSDVIQRIKHYYYYLLGV